MKPLAVDLCCGLGGWSNGFLAEGWDVVGYDIERHVYGEERYPAQLVIQDILTIDGRKFRGKVAMIVASPPCQEFSYMSMPWSRAKAIASEYRSGARDVRKLTALFDACVRIAHEAECPVVIENVRGAQLWVGRSRWAWGSFHLWGDVPALMPMVKGREVLKAGITHRSDGSTNFHGFKNNGGFGAGEACSQQRRHGSKSMGRKRASAMIAKIPLPLSRYIAATFKPQVSA